MNDIDVTQKDVKSDEFLKSHGVLVYTSNKSGRSQIEERWVKSADLYDSRFSNEERKYSEVLGAPRLFIPKTYTHVQRIVVEVLETVFFDQEEIVSVNTWNQVPYEAQQTVKSLLNYRLNSHPIDAYKEFYEAGLDALKMKLFVMKVFPKLKTEKVEKKYVLPDIEKGEINVVKVEEEEIRAYEPCMTVVPPEDVFFSPQATWKDYWKYPIVHRYRKTRDELEEMGFKNVDAVAPIADDGTGDMIREQRRRDTQSPFTMNTNVPAAQEVWVYEVWTHMPNKEKKLVSGSFSMLGDSAGPTVIGKSWEENQLPYKFGEFEYNRPPFVVGSAFPEPHTLYGKDFPEITEHLQKEANAQHNQEREAVARALRPTVYLNRDANVDLMSLLNRRIGGYVQGDGPPGASMQEIPTMNPSMVTHAHYARTDQNYYEASGIPPNLLGTSTNEDTATAATQQLSNANKRISLIIKSLAFTGFVPALTMLLRLEQMYCSDEFVAQVTGKVLGWGASGDQSPSRASIQGDFDLNVNIGVNKQAQLNKLFMTIDRMNQVNQVTMGMVQAGVVNPQQVAFGNPMAVFDMALPLLGFKNEQEGQQPGIASQARLPEDPSNAVANMNPEATGAVNVL